jgi:aryl-alcohol dehydrogenase (NADP+)
MQNHYNLVYREEEREMLPLCLFEGIGVIPWSPLARGFLAGNRRREDWGETRRAKADDYGQQLYYTDADFSVADAVVAVARERGVKPTQVALSWILSQPAITSPIIGASRLDHLDDAVAALDLVLSDEERRRLEAAYVPHRVLGHR